MKKILKKTLSIALILTLVLTLFACGGESESGSDIDKDRVVTFGSTSIATSFDMVDLINAADSMAFSQVYDMLITQENGEYKPSLAESWEVSEDGTVYTFHLRDDVTWSDGEPFTAEDVKFTLEYDLECPNMSFNYLNIKDIEVIDPQTVAVTLTGPDVTFLANIACNPAGFMMPKHAYEQYGEEYGRSVDKIVGTGAYIVTDWQDGVSITFEAREDYFKGTPAIKNIKDVVVADTNAATVALQTGELDIYFTNITGVTYDTLSAADNITISEYMSTDCPSVYMNVNSDMFSDVRMRQAVAYALNKEDILTIAVGGLGQTVNYPADIGDSVICNPNFTPSITYEYDVEKAKALVEECGMTGASITVKSYNTEPWATIGVWLQDSLTAIGLDAKVEPMERSTFLDQIQKGEVDLCVLGWSDTTYDFSKAFRIYVDSSCVGWSGNYGFYVNDEADRLIKAANASSDTAERTEYFRQLVELYMQDVPSIPLYAAKKAIPHNSEIDTVNPTTYNLFDYYWAE